MAIEQIVAVGAIVARPSSSGTLDPQSRKLSAQAAGTPRSTHAEAVASPEDVGRAAARANAVLDERSVSLRFRVDHELDRVIVSVVDAETREVVRQIPPEEMIVLAKTLRELQGMLQGVIVDEQA